MHHHVAPLNKIVPIKLTTDSVLIVRTTCDIAGATVQVNTSFNLLSQKKDHLLHISIRPTKNVVVFKSKHAGDDWNGEESVSLSEAVGEGANDVVVIVFDQGDHYQIMFNYKTVIRYKKRIAGDAASFLYVTDESLPNPFSNPLIIQAYPNLSYLLVRN